MAGDSESEFEEEEEEDASEEDSEDGERLPAKKLAENQAEARSLPLPIICLVMLPQM